MVAPPPIEPLPEEESTEERDGTHRALRIYTVSFVFLVLLPTALALGFVAASFHPILSEDFLFLYFGITSALGVGVWSTLVLADKALDKRAMFFPAMLMNGAAVIAILAALAGPQRAALPLDFSVSLLMVGIIWIMLHLITHVMRHEMIRSRLTERARPDTGAALLGGPPAPPSAKPPQQP